MSRAGPADDGECGARQEVATDEGTLRLPIMINDPKELRDRARQCRELAKTARDEPMRLTLERMADDFDQEAEIEMARKANHKGEA